MSLEYFGVLEKTNPFPIEISQFITYLLNFGTPIETLRPFLRSRNQSNILVCFTGLPGAGKSSLLNAILSNESLISKRVAVVAFDPSSRNGGAFLGDRVRLTNQSDDLRIFFRSIGHRGSLSTLPNNLEAVADTFFHFGYDLVFIETVGMGQTQDRLPEVFDVVVNVQTPNNGDEIQFAKSGFIEVGDIVFFNKVENESDRQIVSIFKQSIELSRQIKEKSVRVISGSVRNLEGIDDLVRELLKIKYIEMKPNE